MATKNFNAKKMLMSTLAAVVFSFVFTTSEDAPKSNLEIRVKDAPNNFEKFIEQVLGIRVRVRV